MKIPQVSTACCGQSLRTASLIIAWIFTVPVGIAWSLYLSILPALYISSDYKYQRTVFNNYHSSSDYNYPHPDASKLYSSSEYTYYPDIILKGVLSITGMISTYVFIEHCLLLWGVVKKQHYFLLPWIVGTCITIFVGICSDALLVILGFAVSPIILLFFIPTSLITSGLVYCLLVIFSYYQELSNINSNTENSAEQVI